MISVTYSNDTEALLEALCERIGTARPWFETAHLVVPNRSVDTYLRFGLARATGVAANLDVRFLRRFVDEAVQAARPQWRLVDVPLLQGLLLAALHDDALLAAEVLGPVRAYLHVGGGSSDALDRRRCQLAETLAHLYDEYGLSRGDWLDSWLVGRPRDGEPFAGVAADTERWQAALWRALFGAGGLAVRRGLAEGRRWLPLHTFARDAANALVLPSALHVFGFSHMAPLFRRLLSMFAEKTQLSMYLLNPCREYWEDVGPRAHALSEIESENPQDALALRLWGRPGRENIRLFSQLTGFQHEERFRPPALEGASLLGRVQDDILGRVPKGWPRLSCEELSEDQSIVFLSAPGRRREVEDIAAEIWRLMLRSDLARGADGRLPLRFNDIALILPARRLGEYLPHLCAFHEARELPFSVVDLPLTSESRVAEALERLLSLPAGRFGREELLQVITHPAIIGRFPDASAQEWVSWCEALGIVHGGDHDDHQGTYVEGDLLNWDQGLRRLALGTLMSGPDSGVTSPLWHDAQAYLPHEVPTDRLDSAAAFAGLCRSLIADTRYLRAARLPLGRWLEVVRALATTYLHAETPADEAALHRCLAEVSALCGLELGGQEVSFRVVSELVLGRLGAMRSGRGQHLADGVVVSSFVPMRAIPFRVIFIAGLGEGDFPAGDRPDPLDLRAALPRAGDVSPREQDRYLFLETLLCARERLYLSHVARDEITGEERAPSTVVAELRELLQGSYLAPQALAALERHTALWRDLEGAVCEAFPAAQAERRARQLGDSLRAAIPAGRAALDFAGVRPLLGNTARASLIEPLGLALPAGPSGVDVPVGVVSITLAALRKFLECPLQGYAFHRLGLREDNEDDLSAREDEAFATTGLVRWQVLRNAFLRSWRRRGPPAPQVPLRTGGDGTGGPDGPDPLGEAAFGEDFDAAVQIFALQGRSPGGIFAAVERDGHLGTLQRWARGCAELGLLAPPRIERFGRAAEFASADVVLPAIVLQSVDAGPLGTVRVEIHGETQPIVSGRAQGSLLLLERVAKLKPAEGESVKEARDVLRAFIDHVARAAADLPGAEGGHGAALVSGVPGVAPRWAALGGLSRARARDYLSRLVSQLLSRTHDYLLPWEAVFEHHTKGTGVATALEALRENPFARYASQLGPVRDLSPYEAPPPDEARAMIEDRFGLFWALRRDGDET